MGICLNVEITPEVLAELKDATEKTRERNREVAKERSALQSKVIVSVCFQ